MNEYFCKYPIFNEIPENVKISFIAKHKGSANYHSAYDMFHDSLDEEFSKILLADCIATGNSPGDVVKSMMRKLACQAVDWCHMIKTITEYQNKYEVSRSDCARDAQVQQLQIKIDKFNDFLTVVSQS